MNEAIVNLYYNFWDGNMWHLTECKKVWFCAISLTFLGSQADTYDDRKGVYTAVFVNVNFQKRYTYSRILADTVVYRNVYDRVST
jgi:hypothetical protein